MVYKNEKKAMGLSAFLNTFIQAEREKGISNDCESTPLNRLLEGKVNKEIARQGHIAGSLRRLVNQHRVQFGLSSTS